MKRKYLIDLKGTPGLMSGLTSDEAAQIVYALESYKIKCYQVYEEVTDKKLFKDFVDKHKY